jgi:transposase InsO family protein
MPGAYSASGTLPARSRQPPVLCACAEQAVGIGFYLRLDLRRVRLCRIRDRRPVHRGGLVHHSDRRSQYVAIKYTERLAEADVEPSVGSVGDSYGNALAETINGLYKAEVIHRRGPWRSFEAVEFATLE